MKLSTTISEQGVLGLSETIAALEYISESPALEFGGFHPQTVLIAKSALKHLREMSDKTMPLRES